MLRRAGLRSLFLFASAARLASASTPAPAAAAPAAPAACVSSFAAAPTAAAAAAATAAVGATAYKMTSAEQPWFTVFHVGTPNGVKIPIALEELGVPYKVHPLNFGANEQKSEWYLKVNPNGRIPALVDHKRGDFTVFESGAILLYLGEYYDPEHKILSADINERSSAIQWTFFQNAGPGPMMGQLNVFLRAPEYSPFAIKRYQDEVKRLLHVYELGLQDGREYLAGKFSIGDITAFGWLATYQNVLSPQYDLEKENPYVFKWFHRLAARPALIKGYQVNSPMAQNLVKNGFKVDPDEFKKGLTTTKFGIPEGHPVPMAAPAPAPTQ